MVKNPWGHMSYKGKFSAEDTKSWTPELKRALGYDLVTNKDRGIFWVDLDTFCTIFEDIYMNWNPDILAYKKSFYDLWKSDQMSQ